MRRMDHSRQTILSIHLNDRHQVQSQQRKVRQIVLCQLFAEQMRVNTAQSPKSVFRHAGAAKVRHLDLLRGADHDVFDLALAIEQHADLPARLMAQLGHLPGKLRRDDRIRRDTSCRQFLDAAKLILLQPARKTCDAGNKRLLLATFNFSKWMLSGTLINGIVPNRRSE